MTASANLWGQPLPVVGLTGKYASGKTLFGLTICPEQTRVYDTEKSSETYVGLGFNRVDVAAEMLKKHPDGYKPIDTFKWWLDDVRSIAPGKYRVIMLDTASEIESGAVDYVRSNPGRFNRTAAQYISMSGLLWGDMKEFWKMILSDLSSRCETFVFTVHLGTIWADNKPTSKEKPKGKSTLMELASLYLQMERKADRDGKVPSVPAAVVLKSRLAHTRLTSKGIEIVPILPPRLPQATPQAIRDYVKTPPDYAKLRDDERAPEQTMTEDERVEIRRATAEAEAKTEELKLEREERQRQKEERQREAAERRAKVAADRDAKPMFAPPTNGHTNGTPPPDDKATQTQLNDFTSLKAEFFHLQGVHDPDAIAETWSKVLAKRGVKHEKELTVEQAETLLGNIREKIRELTKEMEEANPGGRF